MAESDLPTDINECLPQLVLLELPDGSVTGAVMHELRSSYHIRFAGQFVEPDEVLRGLAILRRLNAGEEYGTWRKHSNIDAISLEEAIASSPETKHGQKYVFVYRNGEWMWDIWNNPTIPGKVNYGLDLHSIADFHGTRVSAEKLKRRGGLDSVRAEKTLEGEYSMLEDAIRLLSGNPCSADDAHDYEAHPALKLLCDWWNGQAPDGSREAGFVRLYVWNDGDRIFNPCDPEEPALSTGQIDESPSFALFERDGMPSVLVRFFRGRRSNRGETGGYTTIFAADGSEAASIGLDPEEVDEAYYSLVGLEHLAAMAAIEI
jgi:hypothetical protein